jgi:hypothetical protein
MLPPMSEPANADALPDVNDQCMRGARLVDEGRLTEAAECFRALADRADIAEGTRCVMAVNLATVYDKMGHVETAIQTYEFASSLMVRGFAWIEERRAQYLFEHDRIDDAIGVWNGILTLPFIGEDVTRRIEQNLATTRGKL